MDKLTNTENVGWRPKPNATQPLRWSEKSSLPELIETSQPWANLVPRVLSPLTATPPRNRGSVTIESRKFWLSNGVDTPIYFP